MKINQHNIRQVFEKGIREGERGIARVMACYRWAKTNPDIAREEWGDGWDSLMRAEIARVFGVSPEAFVELSDFYGRGDPKLGLERILRVGPMAAYRARHRLGDHKTKPLLLKIDEMDAAQFTAKVDGILARIEKERAERGRKLAELRGKSKSDAKDPKAEANKLRTELRKARDEIKKKDARIAELEAKVEKLRKLVEAAMA